MKLQGRSAVATGCLLQVILMAGCVAPSTDSGAFRANAVAALSSAVGEARTAALALDARVDDQVTNPYADTVVTDSESALGPIQDSFGSRQPDSPRNDDLRDTVLQVLGDEEDALAHARIAVRRSDVAGLQDADADLAAVIADLTKAQADLG